MQSIVVPNVNHALPIAMLMLRDKGKHISPRGQPTLEIEGPFATTYENPEEMVVFDPMRDANPFFHFFEALWILRGRDDVKFLSYFLPRIADFSDDGKTFHAPYGFRLRYGFGPDQIELAVDKLIRDPDTRQVVLSIWNPQRDWERTKDVPCNDLIMFKVRDNALRMTVCNRSNDAVLGAYGANVVQFSTLQKYIAGRAGVNVGTYTQMSDSFHVYETNPYWIKWLEQNPLGTGMVYDMYMNENVSNKAFMTPHELHVGAFDADLRRFFMVWDNHQGPSARLLDETQYDTDSFRKTVIPMLSTLIGWRDERSLGVGLSSHIETSDWRLAVQQWMERRLGNTDV